jgi:two-component system, cell cycle sensor histidine kinase and response regulator CckA
MQEEKTKNLILRFAESVFLLGIFKRLADFEQARKLVLVNTITLFAIAVLCVIGINSYTSGYTMEGLLDLSAAALLSICIIVLRRSPNHPMPLYVGIGIMTLLYGFLFFSGAANGTGVLWYYTYPVFSLYLLGKRHGSIANLVLFTPSVIYLLWIWPQSAPLYPREFTIRFIPSALCVYIFSYLFEATRIKTHGQLQDKKKELESTIAQLHNKEAQLKKAHDGLEMQVEARTKELRESNEALKVEIGERQRSQQRQKNLEAELVHAQKMQAIGTLAGGVAHDLNNILSGITSYPELIMTSLAKDDPMRKALETVRASGEKAVTIVQDLLTLARRGTAEFETVALEQVVSDYLASLEFSNMISFHPGVTLKTRFFAPPHTISGSAVHLSKSIMNLITNAAEAMPNGGDICVTLEPITLKAGDRIGAYLKPGRYEKMRISDAGTGICPEVIDRIFEPFFSTKKMGRSGTGLGMAVVWGTVEDHQGHIEVRSTPGSGTIFDLYFPAVQPDQKMPTAKVAQAPQGGNEFILIVDDLAVQREIASVILKELGYSVHSVPSGEAAIAYLQKEYADLVLMDMTMDPGLNGLETLRRIFTFKPNQRAVIASGFTESELIQEALQLGARAYLKKPYTIASIAKAIKRAMVDL